MNPFASALLAATWLGLVSLCFWVLRRFQVAHLSKGVVLARAEYDC